MDNLRESEKLHLKSDDAAPESASGNSCEISTATVVQKSSEIQTATVRTDSPPHDCDDYELISLIGQGGMGNVYRAKHKEIGNDVAIKVIHPQFVSDQSAMKRFEQEAEAARDLTHANLVAVYDHGTTRGGSPFLVMDLLDGVSLADLIKKEGFLDVPRALDIFIQLCDALIHAHYKGVVHRDLKPSNVLLTKNDKGLDVVKVLDFGIAKILARSDDNITQTGDVFGSPAYMSPEQCLGLETDARSDIYSLGCIMYECLTGRLPFTGANPIQTIVKQINESPALFGKHSNDLDIPDGLEAVVRGAMEKEVGARYQTMEEVRSDLVRVKDGQTPLRKPLSKKNKKKIQKRSEMLIALVAYATFIALCVWFGNLNNASRLQISTGSEIAGPAQISPGEIRDIHNRLLYKSHAQDTQGALTEAVNTGIDLSGANFAGCTFSHMAVGSGSIEPKLAGADFSRANLNLVIFNHANLSDAKFTKANLTEACLFNRCNLVQADFKDAVAVPGNDLPASKEFLLSKVTGDFLEQTIKNVGTEPLTIFFFSNLTAADLSGAKFSGCQFEQGIMTDAKFTNANLENAVLLHQQLTSADFTGSSLKRAWLAGANLCKAKFKHADLTGAHIGGCIGANFSGAQNLEKAKGIKN